MVMIESFRVFCILCDRLTNNFRVYSITPYKFKCNVCRDCLKKRSSILLTFWERWAVFPNVIMGKGGIIKNPVLVNY